MQLDYFLGVIGSVIFIAGFFPITNNIGEFDNEPPTKINNLNLQKEKYYVSNITKAILIVIDALRLDFGNPRYMPLTSKITNENGCLNTVSVEIPTVTLPRIKALTTGSIPQFIDIVLNLANAKALKDSLIHSAKKVQKKVVFYGDDTWLSLFPNEFDRFEGTNSFFVRDFKEVDDNVTRNLNLELHKDDWDILILHYLGLDHIGHVYGPFSPLIPIKLEEMDKIIYRIHKTVSSKNGQILLMVTSDHGMRDSGGHGGSTYSETKVPLFLIGLNCQNGFLQQSDIPVNLAILLGLNIPSTSVGQVQSHLFKFGFEKELYVLRYNLLLLKQKSSVCDQDFLLASQLHENYLQSNIKTDALKAIELYTNCSKIISQSLIKSSVQQNIFALLIGISILVNVLLTLIFNIFVIDYTDSKLSKILLLLVGFLHFIQPTLSIIFVSIPIITLFINVFKIRSSDYKFQNKFMLLLFVQPLTFIASSFVEEEHQFWYFVNSILILIQIFHYSRHKNGEFFIYCVLISVYLRFIRRLNSTGDQWANYPDLSDWFLQVDNYLYYLIFFVLSLLLLYISMVNLCKLNQKVCVFNILVLVCIFIFKVTESILVGQTCWLLILSHFILFHKNYKILTWMLIGALLLKPYNIILIPFCIFSHLCLKKFFKNPLLLVLCHIWLGNMLFFAQGHSNSLASVDVSVGYIGLYTYQPAIVIFQVILHTYICPVLCHSLLLQNNKFDEKTIWNIIFCSRFYNFFIVSIVTFFLRHHLFIWSVFAPKLFIEFIHTLFLLFEFCCYISIRSFDHYFLTNKFINCF